MKTSDFDYDLPREQIAQEPIEPRDASRLMVLHRLSGRIEHRHFRDVRDYLSAGDMLVANDTRVFPARLFGEKEGTGGRVEFLLLERLDARRWRALVGGRKLTEGVSILLESKARKQTTVRGIVTADLGGPQRIITFSKSLDTALHDLGHTPLPPYIHTDLANSERYQTIYARKEGSAAAPTAGLHFTADLLLSLREMGVFFETCTLHVGLDTFQPVTAADVSGHTIHTEWASLSPESARRINEAKLAGGRIIGVGTTTARVLESAALRSAGIEGSLKDISSRDARGETTDICPWKPVAAFSGRTDLYVYPGYRFRALDGLITNFHLPQSSLLMMVSAFATREIVLAAYEVAKDKNYRFYSFGDAMLIV